jgi:hypothetical protein
MIGAALLLLRGVVLAGDTIDLDTTKYGANDVQLGVAVAVAVAVAILSTLFVKFYSSRILSDEEADHATAVTTGLRSRDWFEVRIPRSALDDGFAEYRDQIYQGFRGDFTADVPTLRAALAETRKYWIERRRAAADVVRDEVPALSRLLSLDAVLYLLVGSLAVVPLSAWGELFTTSSDSPDADAFAAALAESIELVVETIAAFPFAGKLYAFAFLLVMKTGTFLYDHAFVVGFALLFGSIAIWVGDRLVADDVEPRLYRTKPQAAIRIGGVLAATWVAGVVVAIPLRSLHHTIGNVATTALVVIAVGAIAARKATPTIDAAVAAVAYRNVARDVTTAASRAKTITRRLDDQGFDDDSLDGVIRIMTGQKVGGDAAPPFTTQLRRVGGAIAKAGLVVVLTIGVVSGVGLATYWLDGATWAATCGLLASLVVFGAFARRELASALDRLTTAYERADDHGVGPTGTTLYVAARKVFGVLGVFASLILPVYFYQAVATGKAVAVVELMIVDSTPQVKVALAFFTLVFTAFAVVQTRPAWGDLVAACRRALDRNGLRLALMSRGFPVLLVVLAFPILWGSIFFGRSEALVAAVAIGVGTKAFLWLKDRAEYAYAEIDDEPPKPGRVFVKGVVVTDAHDAEIAVVRENDHGIAAPVDPIDDPDDAELPIGGLDELIDQAVADSRSIFTNVEPEPSIYAYYYDRISDGVVDFRQVRREYIGSIGKSIETELEKAGRDGLDEDTLEDRITDDFDEALYRRKFRKERKRPDGIVVYDGRVKNR